MRIALDYDDTFMLDPEIWIKIVDILKTRGHEVRFVTARGRHLDEPAYNMDIRADADRMNIQIIYCHHASKQEACQLHNWVPDIWIDDNPLAIPSDEAMRIYVD